MLILSEMKNALKKIYQFIPLKKELFSVIKFFWVPPHSVYKHLHFNGVFKVKLPDGNAFLLRNHNSEIENDIFWKGLTQGWEKTSMKLWVELCKNANVIFDIGANTGIYTIAAKAQHQEATVYAFEPLQRVMDKLKNNVTLNGFTVECVTKALSDKTGKAIIYEQDSDLINAATLNEKTGTAGQLHKHTEIDTITLDDLIEEKKINKIDLLKIDVETHEPQVIQGYQKYLPVHKPTFLIEILTDEIGEKLQLFFAPLGYLFFNIDDKNDKVRKVEKLTHSDHFNFLICLPETANKLGLN